MSYEPNTVKELLQSKPSASYPDSLRKKIDIISFNKKEKYDIVGSASYRVQKYYGDIDVLEKVVGKTADDVINTFIRKLKSIIREVNRKSDIYFSDFKAGLDERYDVNIGKLVDGVYTKNPNLQKITTDMFKEKLLDLQEFNTIINILKTNDKTSTAYDTISEIFRLRKVVRWTEKEILDDKKELPGGIQYNLKKALLDKTIVKLDTIANLSSNFFEITNVLLLGQQVGQSVKFFLQPKGSPNKEITDSLKEDIEKFMYSKFFYSPFKGIKRLFSLIRFMINNKIGNEEKNIRYINKIIPLITSDASLLYQQKSFAEAFNRLIRLYDGMLDGSLLNDQLDNIKFAISSCSIINAAQLKIMSDLIDRIKEASPKERSVIVLINMLINEMNQAINMYTNAYLKKNNLTIIDSEYLPKTRKYVRSKNIFNETDTGIIKPEKLNELDNKMTKSKKEEMENIDKDMKKIIDEKVEENKLDTLKQDADNYIEKTLDKNFSDDIRNIDKLSPDQLKQLISDINSSKNPIVNSAVKKVNRDSYMMPPITNQLYKQENSKKFNEEVEKISKRLLDMLENADKGKPPSKEDLTSKKELEQIIKEQKNIIRGQKKLLAEADPDRFSSISSSVDEDLAPVSAKVVDMLSGKDDDNLVVADKSNKKEETTEENLWDFLNQSQKGSPEVSGEASIEVSGETSIEVSGETSIEVSGEEEDEEEAQKEEARDEEDEEDEEDAQGEEVQEEVGQIDPIEQIEPEQQVEEPLVENNQVVDDIEQLQPPVPDQPQDKNVARNNRDMRNLQENMDKIREDLNDRYNPSFPRNIELMANKYNQDYIDGINNTKKIMNRLVKRGALDNTSDEYKQYTELIQEMDEFIDSLKLYREYDIDLKTYIGVSQGINNIAERIRNGGLESIDPFSEDMSNIHKTMRSFFAVLKKIYKKHGKNGNNIQNIVDAGMITEDEVKEIYDQINLDLGIYQDFTKRNHPSFTRLNLSTNNPLRKILKDNPPSAKVKEDLQKYTKNIYDEADSILNKFQIVYDANRGAFTLKGKTSKTLKGTFEKLLEPISEDDLNELINDTNKVIDKTAKDIEVFERAGKILDNENKQVFQDEATKMRQYFDKLSKLSALIKTYKNTGNVSQKIITDMSVIYEGIPFDVVKPTIDTEKQVELRERAKSMKDPRGRSRTRESKKLEKEETISPKKSQKKESSQSRSKSKSKSKSRPKKQVSPDNIKKTVNKGPEKVPVKRSTSRVPVKRSASKAPVKRSTSRVPVKRSASKAPVKRSTSRVPVKRSTSRAPAKKPKEEKVPKK